MEDKAVRAVPWGVKAACTLIFVQTVLGSMKGPFVTVAINQGGVGNAAFITALSAVFGMLGNFLVSRSSDRFSRTRLLWVAWLSSWLSTLTAVLFPNTLWPIIPGFLAQFFGVLKALIGDYCLSLDANIAETGYWISSLNFLSNLASMVAPLIAVRVASSMEDVDRLTLAASVVLVAPIIFFMQEPKQRAEHKPWTLKRMMRMKAMKSPATYWMLTWLFFLAGGYHVFNTIMMPSLVTRFQADAGAFGILQLTMGLGGTLGTVASGPVLRRFCADSPLPLLRVMTFFLWFCRFCAWVAPSFPLVVLAYFVLFLNIGVLNVFKAMLWTQFAPGDELGGVFGLQESVEGGLSPLVFPIVTGAVSSVWGSDAVFPCLSVMYVVLFFLLHLGYPRYVQPAVARASEQRAKTD
mmetsp:Transcript_60932/g.188698  ORF Transcript_60932/g.188698 Transcript_60932/m.188698 type:complete len:408 (-) Transcript_60932:95-1318(-)